MSIWFAYKHAPHKGGTQRATEKRQRYTEILMRDFGFKPRVDTEEGLRRTVKPIADTGLIKPGWDVSLA